MQRFYLAPIQPPGLLWLAATVFLAFGLLASGCEDSRESDDAELSPVTQTPAVVGELEVEEVAANLEVPWALAFAPDGRLFFTERTGRVRVIEGGAVAKEPVAVIDVASVGEAGLLGLALDPDFERNHYLYVYHTYRTRSLSLRNRVVRMVEKDGAAAEAKVILDDIPAGVIHSGGRIAFGPDGKLYITTGDTSDGQLAQDRKSLAGKILRLNADGSIPRDNPFPDSPIYTLGHRNPQGLAWHPSTGQLFSTEHGPVGNDEVNIIEKGANYGWPEVQSMARREEYRDPLYVFTPAVAPSGAAFFAGKESPWNGSLFIATLQGRRLVRMTLEAPDYQEVVAVEDLLRDEISRWRDIVQGPDGWLYAATNNRDGRGSPRPGDDRILRLRIKQKPA